MSDNSDDSFFPYHPNHAAPLAFTALFGLALLAHIYQAGRAKALFMGTLIIATIMQVVGYVTRYLSIIHDPSMAPYVVSQVLIVVAPSFLAAQDQCLARFLALFLTPLADYMIVGRMMSYVGPESTFISHTIITKVFVIVDIICVITQASGAGALSGSEDDRNAVMTGRAILIAGLIIQVASFGIFLLIAILFDLKARSLKGDQLKQLRPLFIAFYISAVLVIGRSIYRTIEFGTIDFDSVAQGYLYNNEWPFYVLDAVPVLIATIVFNIINPSSYLPRKKGLRMDGTIEPPRRHWWSSAEKTVNNQSEDYLMTRA